MAIAKTVLSLAGRKYSETDVEPAIYEALSIREQFLFSEAFTDPIVAVEELLMSTATYAQLRNKTALFTYLERLDQLKDIWDRVFADPELRDLLAETLAGGGRHPLTAALITSATRRYDEAGADFLQRLTNRLDTNDPADQQMIERCATAIRYASLTTMHSHRVAVAVLARAGHAEEVMEHLTTIDNIQEARRESGLALRRNEQQLLRQVKRPQANPDIDFQAYTLQEALRSMPLRNIPREIRAEMAKRLAVLGMNSDGWTAAGAASTLVELGALKLAADVVDNIESSDPTRGEGAIALVRELLAIDEDELAAEQTQKALAWIRAFKSENAERATIWGLVEIYLDNHRPKEALELLDVRTEQAGFWQQVRKTFGSRLTDDQLRNQRYRLQAYLQQNRDNTQIQALVNELRTWAPKLLEGDALATFLVDGLLAPLIDAGHLDISWTLLTEIQEALVVSNGDRHAAHLQRISDILVDEIPVLGENGVRRSKTSSSKFGAQIRNWVSGKQCMELKAVYPSSTRWPGPMQYLILRVSQRMKEKVGYPHPLL